MKIVSWNVNGVRAIERKGDFENLIKLDADCLCLQETKAEAEQLTEYVRNPLDYKGYFCSSTARRGYAGTAIYTKTEPNKVICGLPEAPELDQHGRVNTALFKDLALVNVYVPNGKSDTAPLPYKLSFYEALLNHLKMLETEYATVIVVGDFNVAHTEIDLARPKENADSIGFLPEERAWIDAYQENGFVDIWRTLNPHKTDIYTYWDQKSRARERNVGWRIDYVFINQAASEKVKGIEIMDAFLGSDHCPIRLEINL